MISHEVEHGESYDTHTLWRENDDGTRTALYKATCAHGGGLIVTFPYGSGLDEEVAYTIDEGPMNYPPTFLEIEGVWGWQVL